MYYFILFDYLSYRSNCCQFPVGFRKTNLEKDEGDGRVLEACLNCHGYDLTPGQAKYPGKACSENVASYCDGEPRRDHGGGHEEEDEEVDVDPCREDEEDGEQGEGDNDLLHDVLGLGPPPPDPHPQGCWQDEHYKGREQLLERHHQLVTREKRS